MIKYIVCVFFIIINFAYADNSARLVIKGDEVYSIAPHGKGNVYAPDIVRYKKKYYLYYGSQGKDGHDRIQLAFSKDAKTWKRHGIVFFVKGANHVNDPSVLIVNNIFYMYYTLAKYGVTDSIGLATSKDGLHWKDKGIVIKARKPPAWDSLLVGRPSVIYEKGVFRMWYDGRADLPLGAPDKRAPKSAKSHRYVGYAESTDGKNWKRRKNYVFSHDAGGIHVSRVRNKYIMLYESHSGTQWAQSNDRINWYNKGGLLAKDISDAPYGHVTPLLYKIGQRYMLFYGAALARTWDNNRIMMKPVSNRILL